MKKKPVITSIFLAIILLSLIIDWLIHLIYPGQSILRDDHRLVINILGLAVLCAGVLSLKYLGFRRGLLLYFSPTAISILLVIGIWKDIPFHHLAKNCVLVTVDRMIGAFQADKIIDTRIHDRNDGFRYKMIWYRDFQSDMALGVNIGDFKDSNFGTRIHDANIGPEEYSCFPDDVVYASVGDKLEMAYGGYLNWKRQSKLSDDKKMAQSSYHRKHGEGMLSKYIEPFVLKGMSDVNADISVRHTMFQGKRFIRTDVTIRNTYQQMVDFYWVYQDNPVVYLPDPAKARLDILGSYSGTGYKLINGSESNWIGLQDKNHGIGTFMYSPQSMALFVLPRLVGVKGFSTQQCETMGYPKCHLGGNDRYVLLRKQDLPLELINQMNYNKRKRRRLILGLILHFENLKPGESKTLSFFRIAVSQQMSDRDMKLEVKRIIQSINK